MKPYVRLWYLSSFFLELITFQTEVVEKINKHILCYVNLFPQIMPFMR